MRTLFLTATILASALAFGSGCQSVKCPKIDNPQMGTMGPGTAKDYKKRQRRKKSKNGRIKVRQAY